MHKSMLCRDSYLGVTGILQLYARKLDTDMPPFTPNSCRTIYKNYAIVDTKSLSNWHPNYNSLHIK